MDFVEMELTVKVEDALDELEALLEQEALTHRPEHLIDLHEIVNNFRKDFKETVEKLDSMQCIQIPSAKLMDVLEKLAIRARALLTCWQPDEYDVREEVLPVIKRLRVLQKNLLALMEGAHLVLDFNIRTYQVSEIEDAVLYSLKGLKDYVDNKRSRYQKCIISTRFVEGLEIIKSIAWE